jgi:hypothetical protein
MSEAIDVAFAQASEAMLERFDDVVGPMLAHLAAELPDEYGPGTLGWQLIEPGAVECARKELEHLSREAMPTPEAVATDREGARISARTGAGIDWVLFLYRAGHRAQWDVWLDVVEGMGLDPAARRAVLARGSAFFFDYAEQLGRYVTEAYLAEHETIVGSREQRRVRAVTTLLAGSTSDSEDLGHPLEVRHVAVVARGSGVREALEATAATHGRTLLAVAQPEGEWWAWLSGPRAVEESAITRSLRDRLDDGATAGVGLDAEGPDGFRRSHEEALAARRGADPATSAVASFDAVALVALVAGDTEAAKRFVARELRGLDDPSERSGRLRETLEAWFATGQNAAATAALLGIHEQTVAQRLRAVEDRTGQSPAARRAEIETALRLRRHLDTG